MKATVLALLVAAVLVGWGGYQRIQAEKGRTALVQEQLDTARKRNQRQSATITRMEAELSSQQLAQQSLQLTVESLRLGVATDRQHKQEIRNDDPQLRTWGTQPLPDAARRLHQRPAFTGADGYRQWLSSRHTLHTQPSSANKQ